MNDLQRGGLLILISSTVTVWMFTFWVTLNLADKGRYLPLILQLLSIPLLGLVLLIVGSLR